MHVEAEVKVHFVWFHLLADFNFTKSSMKPIETTRKNGQLYISLGVLNVIIPYKEIFTVRVIVDARVCSIFLFGHVLVRD